MQVLTIDVGTGTQDIYLFRSGRSLENGFKLVMPSPTMLIRSEIQEATQRGEDLLLTGVTMGGGPCHWAAESHLQAGHKIFATPEAAKTFNDDLNWVQEQMGVKIISEDEAQRITDLHHIVMRDFDYQTIIDAFSVFGFDVNPDVVAVAVFDHGAAPPDVSDRQFRFDFLRERIEAENNLSSFAFMADDIPPIMTRMLAVAKSASTLDCPLVVMDTAPAAVIGARFDPTVAASSRVIIANVGNFHTLAFKIGFSGIEGVFEHHTGEIDQPRLEVLLQALADGSLTHDEVFNDHGHGALIFDPNALDMDQGSFGVAVTGPRRALMMGSHLRPHFAVPFGDMMISGCFGLLAAVADHLPETASSIHSTMAGESASITPWDAED
jgi:uncharacterized protein (DUF1786 family)